MLVPMGSSGGFLKGPTGGYFVRSAARKQSDSVIPGWCVSSRPGISRFRVRCGACRRGGPRAGPVGSPPKKEGVFPPPRVPRKPHPAAEVGDIARPVDIGGFDDKALDAAAIGKADGADRQRRRD